MVINCGLSKLQAMSSAHHHCLISKLNNSSIPQFKQSNQGMKYETFNQQKAVLTTTVLNLCPLYHPLFPKGPSILQKNKTKVASSSS